LEEYAAQGALQLRELRSTAIDWAIGPAKASSRINGHWQMEGPGHVRVFFERNVRPLRVLDTLQCDAGMLRGGSNLPPPDLQATIKQ
jgi:hypothetical protein